MESRKRSQIFEVMTQKKIDVLFLQETHSLVNAVEWGMGLAGYQLSHSSSVSGGVAILFSKILCLHIMKLNI